MNHGTLSLPKNWIGAQDNERLMSGRSLEVTGGQFPKIPSGKGTDSYSRGTEVDIKAPSQRSLCFFLWFMYCKILKENSV